MRGVLSQRTASAHHQPRNDLGVFKDNRVVGGPGIWGERENRKEPVMAR